jgi:ketol-acid reductoisomerase
MKVYYEKEINTKILKNMKIGILGYGSQGHAHALNLKESGYDVCVGLKETSSSREKAQNEGLEVHSPDQMAQMVDVLMVLIPDEMQSTVYNEVIEKNLKVGATLLFAHGLNIHYKMITPRQDLNVGMVAPKSPGHMVRETYQKGHGVPSLIAVYQDPSGKTPDLLKEYASAIGSGQAGMIETNFKDETETDLFGEQAVLCGGLVKLMETGFETLTNAGYPEELAYFECVHEMKLIVDLIYAKGVASMRESISNTAEYGDYVAGSKIIDSNVRTNMENVLKDIQSGAFTKAFVAESNSNYLLMKQEREAARNHPMNVVGEKLRKMMPFLEEKNEEN